MKQFIDTLEVMYGPVWPWVFMTLVFLVVLGFGMIIMSFFLL